MVHSGALILFKMPPYLSGTYLRWVALIHALRCSFRLRYRSSLICPFLQQNVPCRKVLASPCLSLSRSRSLSILPISTSPSMCMMFPVQKLFGRILLFKAFLCEVWLGTGRLERWMYCFAHMERLVTHGPSVFSHSLAMLKDDSESGFVRGAAFSYDFWCCQAGWVLGSVKATGPPSLSKGRGTVRDQHDQKCRLSHCVTRGLGLRGNWIDRWPLVRCSLPKRVNKMVTDGPRFSKRMKFIDDERWSILFK